MTQQPQHPSQPRREPSPAGEPFDSGPGNVEDRPVERDRAASSSVEATRAEQHDTRTAPPTDPSLDGPKKRGVSGTVWAALILGVIILRETRK